MIASQKMGKNGGIRLKTMVEYAVAAGSSLRWPQVRSESETLHQRPTKQPDDDITDLRESGHALSEHSVVRTNPPRTIRREADSLVNRRWTCPYDSCGRRVFVATAAFGALGSGPDSDRGRDLSKSSVWATAEGPVDTVRRQSCFFVNLTNKKEEFHRRVLKI